MLTRKDLNLESFKTTLEDERKKIEHNIELLLSETDALIKGDEVGDLADVAEIQIENERDRILLNQLRAELLEVDAALGRIEAGRYGICEKTGEYIPVERLVANPLARTIVMT